MALEFKMCRALARELEDCWRKNHSTTEGATNLTFFRALLGFSATASPSSSPRRNRERDDRASPREQLPR